MGGHLCQQLALSYPNRVISICPIASGPLGATEETEKPLTKEESETLKKTWDVFLGRKESQDFDEQVEGFLNVYKYLSGTLPVDDEIAREYINKMLKLSPKKTLQPGNPHEKLMKKIADTTRPH